MPPARNAVLPWLAAALPRSWPAALGTAAAAALLAWAGATWVSESVLDLEVRRAIGRWAEPAARPPAPLAARASVALPRVLDERDRAIYRKVFALQREADWAAAAGAATALADRVLMGHVLFERYMHPTAYRSAYAELKRWLDDYADHPGAERVHKLALRRKAEGAAGPRAPLAANLGGGPPLGAHGTRGMIARPALAAPEASPRRAAGAGPAAALEERVRSALAKGEMGRAQAVLVDAADKVEAAEIARLRLEIAEHAFYRGADRAALRLAADAASRSEARLPAADWIAGLAAWRLAMHGRAAEHFGRVAALAQGDDWLRAAGGFWAARAYLAQGRHRSAYRMRAAAARFPRTFYGRLALQQLEERPPILWSRPALSAEALERLMRHPPVRRALALAEVGRLDLAEDELNGLYPRGDKHLGGDLLALASTMDLPRVQKRLGELLLTPDDAAYHAVVYPVPPWRPEAGFQVDRALLYAFMRRESEFARRALSRAGARGLMQLMPATAASVADDPNLAGRGRAQLFDPDLNVELGQRYLARLLDGKLVDGDLVRLAIAYNAGPSTLARWLREIEHGDDPLLFIEGLPLLETRVFVERMLANLWLYRDRLGQDAPSLAALARAEWPRYVALDDEGTKVAEQ